jgi:hypothetical protein
MSKSMILANDVAGDKSVDPFRGIWSGFPFPLLVIIIILLVILKSMKELSPKYAGAAALRSRVLI